MPTLRSPDASPEIGDVFVGRSRELECFRAGLRNAEAGRGSFIAVSGDPGIGKTRLLEQAAAIAWEQGAKICWGRCYEGPGAPPFWPWVQVLGDATPNSPPDPDRAIPTRGIRDLAELLPPGLRSKRPYGGSGRLDTPEHARFLLFQSVEEYFEILARSRVMVLLFEDLHWADKPSLSLLEHLSRRLADQRILIAGTYRGIEVTRQHPLNHTLAQLTRAVPIQRVAIAGLEPADVGRMIESAMGASPTRTMVGAIHRQTEGNPLFVHEVLRSIASRGPGTLMAGSPGGVLPIPDGIREVIGQRLNRQSDACVRLLTVAAVMGREFRLADLAAVLMELTEDRILQLLDEALRAHVIAEPQPGRYTFSHVLIRETLYDDISGARRVKLHLKIGEALETAHAAEIDTYVTELAYHFGEAASVCGYDQAIRYALRAGERAGTMLAFEEAASSYSNALRMLDKAGRGRDESAPDLWLALGRAHESAGDHLAAMEAFKKSAEISREFGQADTLAVAAVGYASSSDRAGIPGAAMLMQDALAALGAGDSRTKADLLSNYSRSLAVQGRFDQAIATGREAIDMARRLGDTEALIIALLEYQFSSMAADPRRRQERFEIVDEALSLSSTRLFPRFFPLLLRASDLLALGRLDEALADFDENLSLTRDYPEPWVLYHSTVPRAMLALLEGRLEDAERYALDALSIADQMPGFDGSGPYGIQMFAIMRERGRLREIAPLVEQFAAGPERASAWRPGLALIYAEIDERDKARHEYEQIAKDNFAGIPRDAIWMLSTVYIAEVCCLLEDRARAQILYTRLLPFEEDNPIVGYGTLCLGPVARYLGMLAALLGRHEVADAHFVAALEMSRHLRAPCFIAHVLIDRARMRVLRGIETATDGPPTELDEAADLAGRFGLTRVLERLSGLASTKSARNEPRTTHAHGLTERELEVLQLLAIGRSNAEIAQALHISANTVANHVHSILDKTMTANRTEATRLAIRDRLIDV